VNNPEGRRTYRTHEFAELTGVTIRALRHYDRLGLLSPRRTANRYRVYVEADRTRLDQILALKSMGVPLSEVGRLLTADAGELADAFARQRQLFEARTRRLQQTLTVLRDAESRLRNSGRISAVPWRRLSEVSGMEKDEADWRQAFAKLQDIVAARRSGWSAAEKQQMGADWERLVPEVHRSLAEDPAGDHGRQLADRWARMLRRIYGDDVPLTLFITAGRHVAEWHADSQTPEFGKWPGYAFLSEALAAHVSQ